MDANQILQFGAWRIIIKSGLEEKVAKLANCGSPILRFLLWHMADVGSGFLDVMENLRFGLLRLTLLFLFAHFHSCHIWFFLKLSFKPRLSSCGLNERDIP